MTRASDADRDQAVARLREAAAEGRLSFEELAACVERVYEAQTQSELEPLTKDVPAAAPPPLRPAKGLILGILGGGDRSGRWRVPPRLTVVNVMGGADLDLREAVLEAPEIEITVWSLMGGSDITVPEGVHVEFEDFALLGGNDLKVPGRPLPPGAPTVRVRAYSLLGGTDVRTKGPRRRRLPEPPAPPPLP